MSRFDRVPDVPVIIGPCLCPGEPHDGGDIVYLRPELLASGGMAAQGAISDAGMDQVKLQELLWRVFRDHGITGWNLTDDEGEPVPLTPGNIDIALPYAKGGRVVADKADELYNEDILQPFLDQMKRLEKLAADARRKPSADGSTRNSRKATSSTTTSPKTRPSPSSTHATAEAPPAA